MLKEEKVRREYTTPHTTPQPNACKIIIFIFILTLLIPRLIQEFTGGLFFAGMSATPLVLFTDDNKDWGFPLFWVLLAVSYRMSKIISLVTLKRYWGYSDEMCERTRDFKSKRYSRSRVDAYTDGVLAISATLIILDIGSCEAGGR